MSGGVGGQVLPGVADGVGGVVGGCGEVLVVLKARAPNRHRSDESLLRFQRKVDYYRSNV